MLKRVRAWVFGYKIHLYCDHNPLTSWQKQPPKAQSSCDGLSLLRSMILLSITRRGTQIWWQYQTTWQEPSYT